MVHSVIGLVFAGLGIVLMFWLGWMILRSVPAVAQSTTGQSIEKAFDLTQNIAAYTALTGIRLVDAVKADPKALEACDYLRGVVTSWNKPAT